MDLTFESSDRRFDDRTNAIAFTAEHDGWQIACEVTLEALHEHFGSAITNTEDILATFDHHRACIEAAASQKFRMHAGHLRRITLKSGELR